MSEEVENQWVWDAIANGELKIAKTGDQFFDFQSAHPGYGTVLTAFLMNYVTQQGGFGGGLGWGRRVPRHPLLPLLPPPLLSLC